MSAVFTTQTNACSIPVFRYALENWRPDPYEAYVLHRGELTAEQQKLIETLEPNDLAQAVPANLVIRTVSQETHPDEFAELLPADNAGEKLPWLVVRKPGRQDESETVFSAELTATSAARLMDSPVRMTIKDRLLKGHSVVWVYLECGNREKDDETFSMLTRELSRLENELELPEIEEADLSDLSAAPESLKIRFSAVRLSRDDEKEMALCDMLLHVEYDLRDEKYADQPMAFPIFGRGRALYTLVGDGVAPDLVEEACAFLTGACQCTVKAQNPGVDLLIQVDWDRFIEPSEAIEDTLPPLAGFTGFGQVVEDTVPTVQLSETAVVAEDSGERNPPQPDSDAQPPESITSDAQTVSAVAVDSKTRVDPKPSVAGVVWQNAIYILALAGCVVAVASLFLIRRSA